MNSFVKVVVVWLFVIAVCFAGDYPKSEKPSRQSWTWTVPGPAPSIYNPGHVSFVGGGGRLVMQCSLGEDKAAKDCVLSDGYTLDDVANISLQSNKSCWEYHNEVMQDILRELNHAEHPQSPSYPPNIKMRAK